LCHSVTNFLVGPLLGSCEEIEKFIE
jgi:hypothetical protein